MRIPRARPQAKLLLLVPDIDRQGSIAALLHRIGHAGLTSEWTQTACHENV
jgi:hypothetical protein